MCVPLLAVTPALGGAGLVVAGLLIVAERVGKAVRSPAKSTLLAEAAGVVGRGRGFAVHKALDQIGAFAGPLLVAALVAATGVLWPAFAVLAVPAAMAMGLLVWMRRRFPGLSRPDADSVAAPDDSRATRLLRDAGADLPRPFAETKDLIAGWYVIDVESWDREVQLAGELSAAAGAGGEPLHEWLESRPFLSGSPTVTQ